MLEEKFDGLSDEQLLQIAMDKRGYALKAFEKANYKDGIEAGEQAVIIYEKLENWQESIRIRCKVANAYTELAQIEIAQAYLKETIDIGLKHLDEESELIAKIYYEMGYLEAQVRKNAMIALPLFHKSLKILKKIHLEPNELIAQNINNIGFCHWLKADYENALKYMQEALAIRKKFPNANKEGIATGFNNIGSCYTLIEDYKRGLLFMKQALAIRTQIYEANHPLIGKTHHNVATCHLGMKQTTQAIKHFKKALQIRLEKFGEEHSIVAMTYSQLGIALHKQSKYADSLHYFKKALAIQQKSLGEHHFHTGLTANSIASAYLRHDNVDKAIHYCQYAHEIFCNSLGNKHYIIANNLKLQATSFARKGNYPEAFNCIQKALQALFRTPISDNIYEPLPSLESISNLTLMKVLNEKAILLFNYYKKTSKDIRAIETAINVYASAQRLIQQMSKSYRTENSKLLLSNSTLEIYEGSLEASVMANLITENSTFSSFAFSSSEKAKAFLLLNTIHDKNAKIVSEIPATLLEKETRLKTDLTYLEKNIQKEEAKNEGEKDQTLLKQWQSDFFDVHQNYLQLLEKLERDYPDYYRLKYENAVVESQALQAVLEENQVVISYFIGKEQLYIFAITPDEFELIGLRKPTELENQIQNMLAAINQHHFEDFVFNSHQLHKTLINPIQDFIIDEFGFNEGLKEVFIIPHAELSYLPFEALVNETGQTDGYAGLDYLVKHCRISYHYSATLLHRHLEKKRRTAPLPDSFAGFAPIYDLAAPTAPSKSNHAEKADLEKELRKTAAHMQAWATRSDALRTDGNWVSLPHSETEARGIARLFERKGLKAKTYFRADANKTAFLNSAGKYKFLLIAAHGLVNDKATVLSGLVFYPNRGIMNEAGGGDEKTDFEGRTERHQTISPPRWRIIHGGNLSFATSSRFGGVEQLRKRHRQIGEGRGHDGRKPRFFGGGSEQRNLHAF